MLWLISFEITHFWCSFESSCTVGSDLTIVQIAHCGIHYVHLIKRLSRGVLILKGDVISAFILFSQLSRNFQSCACLAGLNLGPDVILPNGP